jgi:hypothetical protein
MLLLAGAGYVRGEVSVRSGLQLTSWQVPHALQVAALMSKAGAAAKRTEVDKQVTSMPAASTCVAGPGA